MVLSKCFPVKFALIILLILLLLVLPFYPAAAQESAAGEQGNWRYLVTGDNVYDLAVSDGHLWQGTSGGLLLRSLSVPQIYRHCHRVNSGLGSNQVLAVASDDKGGAWLGTESGAFYRDSYGRWTHYHSGNSPLAAGTVGVICFDGQGGVWFGTWGGGVSYLGSDKQWQSYNTKNSALPGNRIYAVAVDGQGGVWFGVDGRGAAHLSKDGKWRTFNASGSGLPVNDVLDIVVDSRGTVWFATYQGLACLGNDGKWQVYSTENSNLPADLISALSLAEDGALWVAAGSGVACVREGQVVQSYTKANSRLPGAVVKSLDIDGSGRVWAGTWGGGVACLTPSEGTWAVYDYKTAEMPGKTVLSSNTINDVLPPGSDGAETVWFGTGKGAASLAMPSRAWKNYLQEPQSGGESAQVRRISRSPGGNLAFALDGGGLAVMDKAGTWKRYRAGNSDLPSDAVVDAAFDSTGGLWVATMGGGAAYLSASGKWAVYNTDTSAIPSDYLNAVLVDAEGKVWFGTWGAGAAAYDSQNNFWEVYNTTNSSLPLDDIRCIMGDSTGRIWFGTWGAGLACLDTAGKWNLHDQKSGLPSDIIRSLAVDPAGIIWVATPEGSAYYNGSVWKVLHSGATGLPDDNLWQVAPDRSGNVWFSASESGVAVYNPRGLTNDLQKLTDLAQKTDEIMLCLNDKILQPDVPPFMQNARVLVPLRIISESLGAAVNWDGSSGKIVVELGGKKLELTAGSTKVMIGGVSKELDVPPTVVDGRTLLPLRFIGESLGLNVQWDGIIRAVLLK
jgi:ligand-binding sensor domain-containing protein